MLGMSLNSIDHLARGPAVPSLRRQDGDDQLDGADRLSEHPRGKDLRLDAVGALRVMVATSDEMMKTVAGIKGRGDKKAIEELIREYVDGSTVVPHAAIEERWAREAAGEPGLLTRDVSDTVLAAQGESRGWNDYLLQLLRPTQPRRCE